ncbi:NF-kappa-B inhibitor beta [Monodelphis domestica]|uniref:NFKB inhibitor beta n=1 Tax=Monodelphis domestica TaxID=13616 RepID=F7C514_MONDO|nr:NF-kappa-B inhibitor beta [Monodelphis domestica]
MAAPVGPVKSVDGEFVDEWCDSGLGSLGPDGLGASGEGAKAGADENEEEEPASWAPEVFGYVTEDGDTALHLAVIHQHEAFLDFLLHFTAGTEYLDLQNDLGQTALHIAAILGQATITQKLRAAGAGLCVAEQGGHTPLHLACRAGAHACARALLGPPEGQTTDGEDEEEEDEHERLEQLECTNYQGHTPLHLAVIYKDMEMVQLLREAGADLNKPEPTCGRSPLHLAVEAEAAEVLELLLNGGADPKARMYGGRTPLGSATLRPDPLLACLLRAHGAPEPESEEEDDSSPQGSDSDEGDEYDDIVIHGSRSRS